MSQKLRKIGILGGIGPEATGEFYLSLIAKYQQGGFIKSNQDFPRIIINSIPAPELIYGEAADADLASYEKGLEELERSGADFIAMVCNTIHLFYEDLQKKIGVPIVNLPEEMNRFLNEQGVECLTVLGTPLVVRKGLYRFSGIRYLDIAEADLKLLADAIFKFNGGVDKSAQIACTKNIARKYLDMGAEVLILGCTELSLMLRAENIPVVDTMDILMDATIRHSLSG